MDVTCVQQTTQANIQVLTLFSRSQIAIKVVFVVRNNITLTIRATVLHAGRRP